MFVRMLNGYSEKAEIATKNLMLEILLSNLKLKNKNLSFALNFPYWGVGEIQLAASRSQIDTSGEPAEKQIKHFR